MTQNHMWVVVADASRACILRDAGRGRESRLPTLVMRAPHRHLQTFIENNAVDASYPRSSRPLLRDAHDSIAEDTQEFVRQIVALLESHRLAEDFDCLALRLSPAIFARLQDEMPPRLAATIISEQCISTPNIRQSDVTQAIVWLLPEPQT